MDDSDGNIFDRFAAFLKDEADSSQNAVFTNESNMERDDGHLIRLVPMVDEKEKEAVHFGVRIFEIPYFLRLKTEKL